MRETILQNILDNITNICLYKKLDIAGINPMKGQFLRFPLSSEIYLKPNCKGCQSRKCSSFSLPMRDCVFGTISVDLRMIHAF